MKATISHVCVLLLLFPTLASLCFIVYSNVRTLLFSQEIFVAFACGTPQSTSIIVDRGESVARNASAEQRVFVTIAKTKKPASF